MKVKTRSEAIERYGWIDFSSRYWPAKGKWLVPLAIPKGWFPNWKVLDTDHPVEVIYCNSDMKEPLENALKSVHSKGLGHILKTYDGCLAIRMVRGSNTHFSAHSYGLAIDLNARWNGLGSTQGGFFDHPEFVKCFKDEGLTWGGDFRSRKDAMHFSYCWE